VPPTLPTQSVFVPRQFLGSRGGSLSFHRQFLKSEVGAGGLITECQQNVGPGTANSTPNRHSSRAGEKLLHLLLVTTVTRCQIKRHAAIRPVGGTVRGLHINALGLRCAYFDDLGAGRGGLPICACRPMSPAPRRESVVEPSPRFPKVVPDAAT